MRCSCVCGITASSLSTMPEEDHVEKRGPTTDKGSKSLIEWPQFELAQALLNRKNTSLPPRHLH